MTTDDTLLAEFLESHKSRLARMQLTVSQASRGTPFGDWDLLRIWHVGSLRRLALVFQYTPSYLLATSRHGMLCLQI